MSKVLYVKVFKNRIFFRDIQSDSDISLTPNSPFSTMRLLVGDFVAFSECLKEGINKLSKKGFLSLAPIIVIQPMELNEGGFCELERRVLQEGALSAGARKVLIHEGAELSDQEAASLFK